MTQNHENLEELFDLAYRDDLTGLYNRRFFSRKLVDAFAGSSPENRYCFLLLDIDHFKDINDTHGHAVGDRALESLADLLRGFAGDGEVPVRYAGDEFLLFLPGAEPPAGLQKANGLVERARALKIPLNGGAQEFGFTLSVGVASFPADGGNWEETIEKADEALYAAKQLGRDCASLPPAEGEIHRGDDLSRIFPCPRRVGQEELFARLLGDLSAWLTPGSRRHSALLGVRGARGSGKTRLLAEVAKQAETMGCAVLHLEGSEQRQRLCYGSLASGLLARCGSADELRESAGLAADEAEVWEAFFSGARPDGRPIEAESADRFFSRLLQGFAGARPLALFVDDAELLDAETLRLLSDLAEPGAPFPGPFGILLTTGSGDEGETAGAEPARRTAVLPAPADPGLELRPLTEAQVQDMLKAILPTLRLDSRFAPELHRRSRGNPLYVEEALKLLIQTGRLVYQRSTWNWTGEGVAELPPTLQLLLAARLEALDPEVRGVLQGASFLGREVDPELLQKAHGTNQGHLLDLLDKARRFGILDGDAPWRAGGFRFHSKTAREVSYDQVPESDRIARHLQMARIRETSSRNAATQDLGPLLYHYEMAGQARELEEVRDRLAGILSPPRFQVPLALAGKKLRIPFPEAQPLAPAVWGRVLAVFHLLRAAVQTSRLYPETSQTVSRSCERLLDGFEQVFQHTPCLHLSEVDGTLLANGEAPSWKGEEKRATDAFSRSLTDAGLKGLSFRKGLSVLEVKEFLSVWLSVLNQCSDAARAWEAFEDKQGIEHIQINAKVYVAVSDADLAAGGLSLQPGDMPRQCSDELATLLASLQTKITAIRDLSPGETEGSEEAQEFVKQLERIRNLFPSADTAPPAGHAPGARGTDLIPAGSDVPPEAVSQPAFENTAEDDVRCSLADILSADPQREARGYDTVARMGERAGQALYFHLCHAEDAHAGRVCARLLQTLDPRFPARVREDLERNAEPSVKLRILQHAVPALQDPEQRKRLLLLALEQEEGAAALEALHQLETELPQELTPLLLHILPARTNRHANEICAALGRLADAACVAPLLGYLEQWKSQVNGQGTGFLESVCHALGHYPDPQVVEKLGALLTSTSRIPWRKRVPANLRKAAIQALERIGSEQAASIVKRCEADRDPWIRYRARNLHRHPAGTGRAGERGQ